MEPTLANEIYVGGSAVVSWLIMGRTMMTKPVSAWAIAIVASCMVGIGYAMYLTMTWMPASTFHCITHCFPWGN